VEWGRKITSEELSLFDDDDEDAEEERLGMIEEGGQFFDAVDTEGAGSLPKEKLAELINTANNGEGSCNPTMWDKMLPKCLGPDGTVIREKFSEWYADWMQAGDEDPDDEDEGGAAYDPDANKGSNVDADAGSSKEAPSGWGDLSSGSSRGGTAAVGTAATAATAAAAAAAAKTKTSLEYRGRGRAGA
jgi:hypothetical protein